MKKKKLFKHLSIFDKHASPVRRVLIVGGGRIGYRLAKRLEEKSIACKLIEKRSERCDLLAERLDRTVVLHGDGSDQSLLVEENIHDTDLFVTLTSDEETNILASLLAKRLGAKKTITQVNKFSYFSLMSTIGIEQVVSPRLSAINTILQHIRRGKVLSAISIKGEEGEVMEALALPTSDIVSKPLKKIAFPKGAIVAGIIRKENIIIPTGDSMIEPEDRIIIFATREAIPRRRKDPIRQVGVCLDALALYPQHDRGVDPLFWRNHVASPGLRTLHVGSYFDAADQIHGRDAGLRRGPGGFFPA